MTIKNSKSNNILAAQLILTNFLIITLKLLNYLQITSEKRSKHEKIYIVSKLVCIGYKDNFMQDFSFAQL